MLKQVFASSVILAALIFSGCAQKKADIDAGGASKPTSSKESKTGTDSTTTAGDSSGSGSKDGAGSESGADALTSAMSKLKNVLFDFDKFNIRTDMVSVVDEDVKVLENASVASAKVKLEGNADERGSDEYNYALGLKRAKTVKDALMAKKMATDRISTVTYGETNPVCKEHNEECWQKNRRVEIKLEK